MRALRGRGARSRTGDEETAEQLYREELAKFEEMLGVESTTNHELDTVGRKEFGGKYVGAVPAEMFPVLTQKRPYCIVNNKRLTDPLGGEHWVAGCWTPEGVLLYDSFGRRAVRLIEAELPPGRYFDADRDREQHAAEDNCGPRCMAFLRVAERLGWVMAALI